MHGLFPYGDSGWGKVRIGRRPQPHSQQASRRPPNTLSYRRSGKNRIRAYHRCGPRERIRAGALKAHLRFAMIRARVKDGTGSALARVAMTREYELGFTLDDCAKRSTVALRCFLHSSPFRLNSKTSP